MRPTDYKRIRQLTLDPDNLSSDERARAERARGELRDLVLDELLRQSKHGSVEAARLLMDAGVLTFTRDTMRGDP